MPKQKYLTMRERNLTREEIAELLETREAHTIFERFKVAGRLKWKKEVKRPVDCLPFFFVTKGFAGWHPTEFLAAVMLEKYDQMLTFPHPNSLGYWGWRFVEEELRGIALENTDKEKAELLREEEKVERMEIEIARLLGEIFKDILKDKCKVEVSPHPLSYITFESREPCTPSTFGLSPSSCVESWLSWHCFHVYRPKEKIQALHVGGYAFIFPEPIRLMDVITAQELEKLQILLRPHQEKIRQIRQTWEEISRKERRPACEKFARYLLLFPEIRKKVTADLLTGTPLYDFLAFPKVGSDFSKSIYAVEVKSQKSRGGPYGFWVPENLQEEIGVLLIQMFIREDNQEILVKYRVPTFQKP